MRAGRKILVSAAALAWLALGGVHGPESAWPQGGARLFQSYSKPLPLPDFSLEDLKGKTVEIKEHKGQVIVLNFWATW